MMVSPPADAIDSLRASFRRYVNELSMVLGVERGAVADAGAIVLLHNPAELLRHRIEHLEKSPAFTALVRAAEAGFSLPDGRIVGKQDGRAGEWSLDDAWSWRERLSSFLHRSGTYLAASEGTAIDADSTFDWLLRELARRACSRYSLVPVTNVAFGLPVVDCGSFQVRKFSPEDLSALLMTGGYLVACHDRLPQACERLSAFWYLFRERPRPTLLRCTAAPPPDSAEGGFFFRGVPQRPEPPTSWAGTELEPLALWPWEDSTDLTGVEGWPPDPVLFELPFVLQFDDALLSGELRCLPALPERVSASLHKLEPWSGGSEMDPAAVIHQDRFETYESYAENFATEDGEPEPPENLEEWVARRKLQWSGWQQTNPYGEGIVLTAQETTTFAASMSEIDRSLRNLRSHPEWELSEYIDRALEFQQVAMTADWPDCFLLHVRALEALLVSRRELIKANLKARLSAILGAQERRTNRRAETFDNVWDLRCRLSHGQITSARAARGKQVEEARALARLVTLWFLNFLDTLLSDSRRALLIPNQRDILALLDGDRSPQSERHRKFVESIAMTFPAFPRLGEKKPVPERRT